MKKNLLFNLSISANILLALLATFLLFNQADKPDTSNCTPPYTDFSDSGDFHFLNGDLLQDMANNYQSNIQRQRVKNTFTSNYNNINRADTTLTDACSIWFSLNNIKRFFWEIEKGVCINKGRKDLNLGVRIYYARYPNLGINCNPNYRNDLMGLDTVFEKMHTVFMVPTYDQFDTEKNVPVNHIDFDPTKQFTDGIPTPIMLKAEEKSIGQIVGLSAFEIDPGTNHGRLCPPLTNCYGAAFINRNIVR
jgi:hypothetical protein